MFTGTGTISGSWDPATGVLLLNGTDSHANYASAISSVSYVNLNDANPSTASREVSISVSDGNDTSAAASRLIDIHADNDAPTLTLPSDPTVIYTENAAPVPLAASISVADVDNPTLTSATVRLTNHYHAQQDSLLFTDTALISGLWNSLTGELQLTGSATLAQYQEALRTITYHNTSDNPQPDTRTAEFVVNDGSTASAAVEVAIQPQRVNDATLVINRGDSAVSIAENAPPTAIATAIELTDADSTELVSATVAIDTNYHSTEDLLAFSNTDTIVASWNAALGTLTLSGVASVADYQAALRDVSYQNTSDNPSTDTRSISFLVNDGMLESNAISIDVAPLPADDSPTLSLINSTLSYPENAGSVAIADTLTVSDIDSIQLHGATISIDGNYNSTEDQLAFTNTATITGSWNSTDGTLTLTGVASVSDYQAALRSISYHNDSDHPATDQRTISIAVSDGHSQSNVQAVTLTPQRLNDAPVLQLTSTSVSVAENSPPQAIIINPVITDMDSTELSSAMVRFSDNYEPTQDTLTFVDSAAISGTWNPIAGELHLSGTASLAAYQNALASVSYQNSSENPSAAPRTLLVSVNDGSDLSASASVSLSIVPSDDAPSLTIADTSLLYPENAAPIMIASDPEVSDVDSAQLQRATIRIDSHYQPTEDLLAFTDTTQITGSWDSSTGTLTLIGSATPAQYQQALRAVSYANTSDSPNLQPRAISFSLFDDTTASNTVVVNVSPVASNDPPALSIVDTAIVHHENDTATLIAATLSIDDIDSPQLESARIGIELGYQDSQDQLLFSDTANITGNWDAANGVLTLTGSASVADYQQAVRSIEYRNTDTDNPSVASRTLSIAVFDAEIASNALSVDLAVAAINDAPTLTLADATAAQFVEGPNPIYPGDTIQLNDPDSTLIHSARVQISANFVPAEDRLAFANTAFISASWQPLTGLLELTGNASVADYEAALRSIEYRNSSDDPDLTARTLSFSVSDATDSSSTVHRQLNIIAVNDAPMAANSSIDLDEDTAYTLQTSNFGFTDTRDNNQLQDVVIVTTPVNGTLRFNDTAVLPGDTISAADIANGLLVFNPEPDRFAANYANFSFRVTDDGGTANGGINQSTDTGEITFNVNPVNDPPSAIQTINGLPLTIVENTPPGTLLGRLTSTDADPLIDAVIDGNFSTLPAPNADANNYAADGQFNGNRLGDWLVTEGSVEIRGSDWQASPDGGRALDTAGLEPGAIEQTFSTIAGARYELSFALAGNFRVESDTTATKALRVSVDGNQSVFRAENFSTWTHQNLGWRNETLSFTATSDSTTIEFRSMESGRFGTLISDISLLESFRYLSVTDPDNHFDVSVDGSIFSGPVAADFESADHIDIDVQSIDANGLSVTDTVSIAVLDVNESPFIDRLQPLPVEDGLSAVITPAMLSAGDPDAADASPGQLGFTLQSTPTHGTLLLNGTPMTTGSGFSQADINNGVVIYQHSGGDTGNDFFTVELADGGENGSQRVTAQMDIEVDHVNESPVLLIGNPIQLLEGDTITLSSSHFNATDGDTTLARLNYVVTELPSHGILFSTADPSQSITTFTQQDLADGLIQYRHDSSDTTRDAFSFELFDELDDNGATADQATIIIDITDVADAPVGADLTIATLELSTLRLDPAHFGFDDGTDQDQLRSVIIDSIPDSGSLALGQQNVTAGQTIPVAALQSGQLGYTPAATASVGEQTSVSFRVRDDGNIDNGGQHTDTVSRTLTIDIGDSESPIAVNDRIEVIQRDTITSLSSGESSVLANDRDSDSGPAQLLAVLLTATEHGSIELFSDGSFRYVHDGSDNFTDQFSYRVIDGNPDTDTSVSNTAFVEIAIEPLPPGPVAGELQDTLVIANEELSFPLPVDLFQGGAPEADLVFSATLSNGDPLPVWLIFDSASGTFGGTPRVTDTGTFEVAITASDINGKTATSTFTIDVEPPSAAAQVAPPGTPVEITAPAEDTPTPPVTSQADTVSRPEPSAASEPAQTPQASPDDSPVDTDALFEIDHLFTADDGRIDNFEDTVVKNDRIVQVAQRNELVVASNDPLFTASLERLFYVANESTLESARRLINQLDRERDELAEISRIDSQAVASAITVSTGLSIGYIVWLVRGGLLVGSVLSSMPAWRWIDPLPVLSNINDGLDEDDESLQSMVNKNDSNTNAANSDQPNAAVKPNE